MIYFRLALVCFICNYNIMKELTMKPLILIRPPLPNARGLLSPRVANIPLSPRDHIVRTNSNSKTFKKTSAEKSIKEKQIQKQIKYAKSIKTQQRSQISFCQSQNNLTQGSNNQLQSSQQTIQKTHNCSRQKRQNLVCRLQLSRDKCQGGKMFDSISGVSGSNTNKRSSGQKNEEYYVYWKNKAHQYLDSNMKLMEEVRKLTKENEELKLRQKEGKQLKKQKQSKISSSLEFDEKKMNDQLRKLSLIYMGKIQEMEKELKRKEIIIYSYELKVNQLNVMMQGDSQRIKLMQKMSEEIQELKAANNNFKIQMNTGLGKIQQTEYSLALKSHKNSSNYKDRIN